MQPYADAIVTLHRQLGLPPLYKGDGSDLATAIAIGTEWLGADHVLLWAIEGLTKATSIEVAPLGIRVNTICPTFIETPLTKPYFEDPAFGEHVRRMIKIGRVGQVDDITGAALYLASDASSLMTGSSMVLDGGWTAE